jgi:hypothetical protein
MDIYRHATRSMLVGEIHNASHQRGKPVSFARAGRLFRFAVNDLVREGTPLVSLGKFFMIAKTPQQRRDASSYMRSMGLGCLVHAARINQTTLEHEMRQALLDYGDIAV